MKKNNFQCDSYIKAFFIFVENYQPEKKIMYGFKDDQSHTDVNNNIL